MTSKEIRQSFIDFFQGKGHRVVHSAPVVPLDDPTLLFTNAGMNQFKPIFLNQTQPESLRVVNSQKCIRVSGKHNDLEEVGVDNFHHTFFEMLGNWSFGDYYKKEAISWAWELFTETWCLDKDRLWATVYEEDEDAYSLWTEVTDIAPERVLKCGKKDNFWEMGETGPCGPCSEIHYFVGGDADKQTPEGINKSDEYWELWNLVFIQNNRSEDGVLEDLPEKHVDTGLGLERIAAVLQGRTSSYDTDLFQPIIQKVESIAGSSCQNDPVAHKVIADHIRMLCFSIADGALPSNEGRGYVLRRILRRAARFGRILGMHEPFLYKIATTVGDVMGETFPEVMEKRTHIEKVIQAEEVAFNHTLDRGLTHFDKISAAAKGNEIVGAEAFKLYDTYGFPLDLTQLMAQERGFSVDVAGFEVAMAQQKQSARDAGKFMAGGTTIDWITVSEGSVSEFTGFEALTSSSHIRRYAQQGKDWLLVVDKTPFYAESGGQVGDTGTIRGQGIELKVKDVKKDNHAFIHVCTGELNGENIGEPMTCAVDGSRRDSIRRNHTATHLLHRALKQVLGDHVHQAGSLVHPEYLRFDLTHYEKVTKEQQLGIENIINQQILLNSSLEVSVKKYKEAKEAGVEALFGEKYSEEVRVVQIGEFSMELCGGTHVNRTGDIGFFHIIEESSLASGVRRIVALTGNGAIARMQTQAAILDELQRLLNIPPEQFPDRIGTMIVERKKLEKRLRQRLSDSGSGLTKLLDQIETVKGHQVLVEKIEASSMDDLKRIGDEVRGKLTSGIGALFMAGDGKPSAVVVVADGIIAQGQNAGTLAKSIGSFMGGGGGGKPHLATAGGSDVEIIEQAMDQTKELIINCLTELE